MQLRLDVGVSATGSLTAIFRSFVASSAAARKTVAANLGGALADAEKVASGAAAKAGKEQVAAAQKTAAAHRLAGQIQADIIKSVQAQRNAEHKQFLADLKEEEREAKKVAKSIADEKKKQAKSARDDERRNERVGSAAMRTFGGYLSKGASAMKDVAQAYGVDFSVTSGIGRSVALETAATNIVNNGNRGGGSAADRNAEVDRLQELARNVGDKYKIDATQVLSGLGQYQALTGDLDTAKAGLEGLARLSKAFNVDLDKMVGAAGQVGSAIGEVGKEFASPEEKANAILNVLKQATAQGQEGAIEISDLATQYAKLKAAGMRFEGNTGANISKMSALAQLSYQTGGAGSVREASNAIMGFVNTLATPARRREFKMAGIAIENSKGQFLDPYEIIRQSLKKTGGDRDKMNALFKNVVGAKAIETFSNAYRNAGGGDMGIKAVDAQIARFGGTVTDDQIQENLKRALNTKASQAQGVQNEWDRMSAEVGNDLAPALRDLAPHAIEAARGLAEVAGMAARHPEAAIVAALVASIAKAAIGETVGKALGSAIGSAAAPAGLAIGALAIAAAAAAAAIEDYTSKSNAEKGKSDKDAALVAKAEKQLRDTGKIDKDTIDELAQRRAEIEGQRTALRTGGVDELSYTQILAAKVKGGADQVAAGEGATAAAREAGADKLDTLATKMDQLIAQYSKPMRVHVDNAADIRGQAPGPNVDSGARSDGVR